MDILCSCTGFGPSAILVGIFSICFDTDLGGGGTGLSLLKTLFWAMGWGDGLEMYPQLEGGFGSMRAMLPMWGFGAKNGAKTKSYTECDRAKLLTPFD